MSDQENSAAATEAAPAKTKKPATVYETVKMEDGREVKFPGERKVDKEILEDADGTAIGVRVNFRNGKTRTLLRADIPAKTDAYSSCHGLSQKVGDEWSDAKAKEMSIDDIVMTCDEVMGRLKTEGGWFVERGTGDSMAGASMVITALVNVTGKGIDEIKAFLQGKLDKAKAAGESLSRQQLYASFRANPQSKVAVEIARLEQERAAKNAKVDADALLAEIEAA